MIIIIIMQWRKKQKSIKIRRYIDWNTGHVECEGQCNADSYWCNLKFITIISKLFRWHPLLTLQRGTKKKRLPLREKHASWRSQCCISLVWNVFSRSYYMSLRGKFWPWLMDRHRIRWCENNNSNKIIIGDLAAVLVVVWRLVAAVWV
jgi:hypothetical protein